MYTCAWNIDTYLYPVLVYDKTTGFAPLTLVPKGEKFW